MVKTWDEEYPEYPSSSLEQVQECIKPTQKLYWQLINTNFQNTDICAKQWATELKIDYKALLQSWPKILIDAWSISNAAKLRYMQYKILNKILITNVTCARWDKSVSSLCSFYFSKNETIMHLLVECCTVQKLWYALTKWVKFHVNIQLNITNKLVILNNYSGIHERMVNTLILIMKQYIYSSKCKST